MFFTYFSLILGRIYLTLDRRTTTAGQAAAGEA